MKFIIIKIFFFENRNSKEILTIFISYELVKKKIHNKKEKIL
jgi:hypothetical protein